MVAGHSSSQKPTLGRRNSGDSNRLAGLASTLASQLRVERDEPASYPTGSEFAAESLTSSKCEDCHELCAELWCKNCYSILCSNCDGQVHHSKSNHVRIPFGAPGAVKPRSPQSVLAAGAALGEPCASRRPKADSPKGLAVSGLKGRVGAALLWPGEGRTKGKSGEGNGGESGSRGSSEAVSQSGGLADAAEDQEDEARVGSFTEEDIFAQGIAEAGWAGNREQQDGEPKKSTKENQDAGGRGGRSGAGKDPDGGMQAGRRGTGPRRPEDEVHEAAAESAMPSGSCAGGGQTAGSTEGTGGKKVESCQQQSLVSLASLLESRWSPTSPVASPPMATSSRPHGEPASATLPASHSSACITQVEESSTAAGGPSCGERAPSRSLLPRSASVPISSQASRGKAAMSIETCSPEESDSSSIGSPASSHPFLLRASSCPTVRASALRGSRPRPTGLHVRWAPEVWDPPPSSASHTVTSSSSSGRSRRRSSSSSRTRRKGDSGKGADSGKGKRGKSGSSSSSRKSSSPSRNVGVAGPSESKGKGALPTEEGRAAGTGPGRSMAHDDGEGNLNVQAAQPDVSISGGPYPVDSVDAAFTGEGPKAMVLVPPAQFLGTEEGHQTDQTDNEDEDFLAGEWNVVMGKKGSKRGEARGGGGSMSGRGSAQDTRQAAVSSLYPPSRGSFSVPAANPRAGHSAIELAQGCDSHEQNIGTADLGRRAANFSAAGLGESALWKADGFREAPCSAGPCPQAGPMEGRLQPQGCH